MDNDAFKRLKRARLEAGFGTAQAFAAANDISLSTYRAHESGARNLTIDRAREYAEALSVDWEWLLFNQGELKEPSDGFESNIRNIPLYDLAASAGAGALGEDCEVEQFVPFRADMLAGITSSAASDLAVLRVSGDSMEPTLADGDQIMLDLTVDKPKSDGIYVVDFDGSFMVKRLAIDPFRMRVSVRSDNPNYSSFDDIDPALVRVVGRVIWLGRRI